MMCSNCNSEVQADARFCSKCGVRLTPAWTSPTDAAAREGLYRSRYNKKIAGVCAGFAQRYGWDVTLLRLLLVVVTLFGCGTPLVGYIIAWVIMPTEPFAYAAPSMATPAPAPSSDMPQA